MLIIVVRCHNAQYINNRMINQSHWDQEPGVSWGLEVAKGLASLLCVEAPGSSESPLSLCINICSVVEF